MQELLILGNLITDLKQTALDTGLQFGVNWPHFIAAAINFCIVAGVLWFFVSKPVLNILEERRTKIEQSIADAEKIKHEIAQAEAKRQEILTKTNEDAKALLEEARAMAAQLREQETQKAIVAAEEIISKAKESTQADYDKMLNQLKGEVSRLVVDTAVKVIGEKLSPDLQKQLSADALIQLKQTLPKV